MSQLAEFLSIGEKLGLTDVKLKEFVEEQVEREEKRRKEEIDREEKRRNEEIAREEKQRQDAIDREERAAKRELEKMKIELQMRKGVTDKEDSDCERRKTAKAPKLPQFRDDKDDIDAYLERFERYAKAQDWKPDQWATNLSALLGGKALDVYYRMPLDTAGDYLELKASLLKRYNLTEEGFRERFRFSKAEPGESPQQFMTRLESYLKKWMQLASVKEEYEELRCLLVKEQFIDACHKDLAVFLREKKPKLLQEVVEAAERFQEAHGGHISGTRRTQSAYKKPEHQSRDTHKNTRDDWNKSERVIPRASVRTQPTEDRNCYICNEKGHMAKNCNKIGRPEVRTCFLCNKKGHIAKNCKTVFSQNDKRVASCIFPQSSSENSCYHRVEDNLKQTVTGCACTFQQQKDSNGSAPEKCSIHCCSCLNKLPVCLVMELEGIDEDATHIDEDGVKVPICHMLCDNPVPVCFCGDVPTSQGFVNRKQATTMRDTGCAGVIVKCGYVEPGQYTGHNKICRLVDGSTRRFPTAMVDLDSPFYVGKYEAMVMPTPLFDVIIGNIPGAREPTDRDLDWRAGVHDGEASEGVGAVTTRSQAKRLNKDISPLQVAEGPAELTDTGRLIQDQKADDTLKFIWNKIEKMEPPNATKSAESWYEVKEGLLYRYVRKLNNPNQPIVEQLVVPEARRSRVTKLAHDSLMSGHMGIQRTTERILNNFFWPGVYSDVKRFCQSCDICQRTTPKGKIPKAPLENMPVIDTPFKRIAIDIVGPINPMSERKNRYVLTVVDYATRYPEAVPLPTIETERVAEALLEIFSRVGFPSEILSDMGSNFTSGLMKEVTRLISVKHLTTTPYHPICNGLCERFNGTLKQILRRLCSERPSDWDRYLPAVLFAYREATQESLGFSPFELVYGRTVRGPLEILKTLWTGEAKGEEVKTTYNYVLDLREKLEKTMEIAHEELRRAATKHKSMYDRKTKDRVFTAGDDVLILLPTDNNKLVMQWKGPFAIIERVGKNDYRIQVKDKIRIFHVNMLKLYVPREACSCVQEPDFCFAWDLVATAVVEDEDPSDNESLINTLSSDVEESYLDVKYGTSLTTEQRQQAEKLVSKYRDIFTNLPGTTDLCEHKILLVSDEPIKMKPYPLPYSVRQAEKEEVDRMLASDIIERSDSPYCSPIVMVKKKDGSMRFCIDFRRINQITIVDSEPMPNPEDIFATLEGDAFFTKIDLSKGYWQIPLRKEDQCKTAFSTPEGHFHFKKMPFGLVNATATFNRLMRSVLHGIPRVHSYVDEILGHTPTWSEHLQILEEIFTRIRNAKLTVRPTKCEIGCKSLSFIGQQVEQGTMQPHAEKVAEILQAPIPKTKRQVRSFMGLVGYYRSYIPNFSALAAPLTNLLKKGQPREVKWVPEADVSFQKLKEMLSTHPILRLPDLTRPFILQADASDSGVGASLLQEFDDGKFPVAYASKKLLPREMAYSVIEKECLALVWAIKRYMKYLFGSEFILETDHQPLTYIAKAKLTNSRIMRWALLLQNYKFQVRSIKGKDNVVADYLSRL